VDIPKGTLVPTLPLRFNYLLWIEDLLEANGVKKDQVKGLDVGVGAACIYPLLAVKHLGWKMLGTEANKENLSAAVENVSINGLCESIRLTAATEEAFECLYNESAVTFTMCNPPFYCEEEDVDSGQGDEEEQTSPSSSGALFSKRSNFSATPAGAKHEMKTHGGEIEFVSKMVSASTEVVQKNFESSTIFTCMLGHKSSLKAIKKVLEETRPSPVSVATTEFCQGRTMRWGVAWAFKEGLVLPETSLLRKKREEKKLHEPVLFEISLPAHVDSVEQISQKLSEWLTAIDIETKGGKMEDRSVTMTLKTYHQNWKGQRRRRR